MRTSMCQIVIRSGMLPRTIGPEVRSGFRAAGLLMVVSAGIGICGGALACAEDDTSRARTMLDAYFRAETARLADASLADINSLEDWKTRRGAYKQQLLEMLGLDPLPEQTPLEAEVSGTETGDGFRVEKLHFQSRPGLYVTGNLYLPEQIDGSCPTVLYVCGHGRVKIDGVSYGNKVHYHHHGVWFARHGYVCLTIDTLQLGEIEGLHHGTHREGMWWWNSRGYTPAGVEAWNCVRALDYLETREEVDAERIGVTGRSGGGAYSWWISAIDERIKAAVPVAGITDLENHVVDDCVEGHCDCMFMVNTYGWDYPQVAALVAPRPLLIANSDKDGIFPLDGVVRVHAKVRKIYELYGAEDQLGLHITEGPHEDTQRLRVGAFHWMNRFLKGEDPLIETTAEKTLEPGQLKVFDTLPSDARNAEIQEEFTQLAEQPDPPTDGYTWRWQRAEWLRALREKCFRGWPQEAESLEMVETSSAQFGELVLRAYEFRSQGPVRLPLFVVQHVDLDAPTLTVLNVFDDQQWEQWTTRLPGEFATLVSGSEEIETAADSAEQWSDVEQMLSRQPWAAVYFPPRGIGPTNWGGDERDRTHIRRRFMLLGQTLDGMRVWDVRRAVAALRSLPGGDSTPIWIDAKGVMAGIALYAGLFEPAVERLDLWHLPATHREGPTFLNVRRVLDMPQAVAMASERRIVRLYGAEEKAFQYADEVGDALNWPTERLQFIPAVDKEATAKQ